MFSGGPLFCDVTWHSKGNPGKDQDISSMGIASAALNYCSLETMLHLTSVDQSKDVVTKHLEKAKAVGITNILALRGGVLLSCSTSLGEVTVFRYLGHSWVFSLLITFVKVLLP